MRKWFKAGKAEMDWYGNTRQALSVKFGADVDIFLSMLAATSINATVKSNVRLAEKAYAQYKAGQPFEGYLPVVRLQLERIVRGEKIGGRKLQNFAEALQGNPDAVVIDRWMLRAAGLRDKTEMAKTGATKGEYDKLEKAIKRLAAREGVEPRQAQAAVWFGIKHAVERQRGVVNPAPPFEQLVGRAA